MCSDSLEWTGIAVPPEVVLKVGFLNENTIALRPKYEAIFDAIILVSSRK
jgi:hypothetical protein